MGQERIKSILSTAAGAAQKKGMPMRHVLLGGPPGLGKTTLARAIATTLGSNLHSVLAPTIEKPIDLLLVILKLKAGDVLFIDEIHRLSPRTEESLFTVLEDGALDVLIEGSSTPTRIELKPFTLIGATTHIGGLSPPFRDRFPLSFTLEPYSDQEIGTIIEAAAELSSPGDLYPNVYQSIARRSRGIPRVGLNLLALVLDHVNTVGISTRYASQIMDEYGVDENGLTRDDRRYIRALGLYHPSGLESLSQKLNIPTNTLTTVIEPFLLRQGLIERCSEGRVATGAGCDLIHKIGETEC